MFDKGFLTDRLVFNGGQDIDDGYEDYGRRGRSDGVATHAIVFMLRFRKSRKT